MPPMRCFQATINLINAEVFQIAAERSSAASNVNYHAITVQVKHRSCFPSPHMTPPAVMVSVRLEVE